MDVFWGFHESVGADVKHYKHVAVMRSCAVFLNDSLSSDGHKLSAPTPTSFNTATNELDKYDLTDRFNLLDLFDSLG